MHILYVKNNWRLFLCIVKVLITVHGYIDICTNVDHILESELLKLLGIHGNSCLNFKNGSKYKEKIYTFFLKICDSSKQIEIQH